MNKEASLIPKNAVNNFERYNINATSILIEGSTENNINKPDIAPSLTPSPPSDIGMIVAKYTKGIINNNGRKPMPCPNIDIKI